MALKDRTLQQKCTCDFEPGLIDELALKRAGLSVYRSNLAPPKDIKKWGW